MSAAKKVHALRGDDSKIVVDAAPMMGSPAARQQAALDAIIPPHGVAAREERHRKLTVGEKLAEGRGFWRGVVTGGLMGLGLGVLGAVATFATWAPLIQDMARDYLVLGGIIQK